MLIIRYLYFEFFFIFSRIDTCGADGCVIAFIDMATRCPTDGHYPSAAAVFEACAAGISAFWTL